MAAIVLSHAIIQSIDDPLRERLLEKPNRTELSAIYSELKIRKIPITIGNEFLIQQYLISSDWSDKLQQPSVKERSEEEIVERRRLIIDLIKQLDGFSNYDSELHQILTFLLQNLHILKRQETGVDFSSYTVLPWEEVEFLLSKFIEIYFMNQTKNDEILLKLLSNLSTIKVHLKNFANKLGSCLLPKLHKKRNERNKIIQSFKSINYPNWNELLNTYNKIRNISSLRTISYALIDVININLEENLETGIYCVQRFLQIIGENLKNTTESPYISEEVEKTLLVYAQPNLKKLITDLRNDLIDNMPVHHKIRIEQKTYFEKIQKDIAKLQPIITHVLMQEQACAIKTIAKNIVQAATKKDILEYKKSINVNDLKAKHYVDESFYLKLKKILPDLQEQFKAAGEDDKKIVNELSRNISQLGKEYSRYVDYCNEFKEVLHKHLSMDKMDLEKIKNAMISFSAFQPRLSQENVLQNIVNNMHELYVRSEKLKEQTTVTDTDLIRELWLSVDQETGVHAIRDFYFEISEENEIDRIFNMLSEKELLNKKTHEFIENRKVISIKLKVLKSHLNEKCESINWKIVENLFKEIIDKLDKFDSELILPTENEIIKIKNLYKNIQDKKYEDVKRTSASLKWDTIDTYKHLHKKSFQNIFNVLANGSVLRDFLKSVEVDDKQLDKMVNFYESETLKILQNWYNKRLRFLKQYIGHSNRIDHLIQNETLMRALELIYSEIAKLFEESNMFTKVRSLQCELVPLLSGKILRNYLIHGNMVVNVLPFNPRLAVIANCQILAYNKNYIDIRNLLINKRGMNTTNQYGTHRVVNVSDSKQCHDQIMQWINSQKKLQVSIENWNLGELKVSVKENANFLYPYHITAGYQISLPGIAFENHPEKVLSHFILESVDPVLEILVDRVRNRSQKCHETLQLLHPGDLKNRCKMVNFLMMPQCGIKNEIILLLAIYKGLDGIINKVMPCGNCEEFEISTTKDTFFHIAAELGSLQNIRTVMEKTNSPDKKLLSENAYNLTPIHLAAKFGHVDVVDYFMSKIRETKKLFKKGSTTPAHIAAKFGQLNVIEYFLKNYLNETINCKNAFGTSLLHFASEYGHSEVAKTIITFMNSNQTAILIDERDKHRQTPLHLAAKHGHSHVVQILLNHGADVDAETERNFTPLYLATQMGQTKVVKLLLPFEKGIRKDGTSIQHIAAKMGYINIITLLKGRNWNIKNSQSMTPMHLAVEQDRKEAVETILTFESVDPSLKQYSGKSAAFLACEFGNIEILDLLCQRNKFEDLKNERSKSGWTVLHYAAKNGHLQLLLKLIKEGLDVNAETDLGRYTPLYLAIENNHLDIVRELIKHGADFTIIQKHGLSLLHSAAKNSSCEMVALLLENLRKSSKVCLKDFINLADESGFTALHYAAIRGDVKIVKELLKNKADKNCLISKLLAFQHCKSYNMIIKILEKENTSYKNI